MKKIRVERFAVSGIAKGGRRKFPPLRSHALVYATYNVDVNVNHKSLM